MPRNKLMWYVTAAKTRWFLAPPLVQDTPIVGKTNFFGNLYLATRLKGLPLIVASYAASGRSKERCLVGNPVPPTRHSPPPNQKAPIACQCSRLDIKVSTQNIDKYREGCCPLDGGRLYADRAAFWREAAAHQSLLLLRLCSIPHMVHYYICHRWLASAT